MSDEQVGVSNPYALAEVALGRRVRWEAVPDRDALVVRVLGASPEALLAPTQGNLLYAGSSATQKRIAELRTARKRSTQNEAPSGPDLRDVAPTLFEKLDPKAQQRVLDALTGGRASDGMEYTPAGAEWADPGDFFEETSEFHDPVQGALGDCYFIAALSAVAWARPYVIVQRTRATGPTSPSFVDRIDFYAAGSATPVEVSELLPVGASTHHWIYARSSETGEIWPAVYEKAFAKWKTSNTTDRPDYGPIAGGWPVQATVELTNLTGVTRTCSDHSADDLWSMVRANSLSRRTINPMTAWTFCTPTPPVDYGGSGLVGYHAYTVLGWAYVGSTQYVVLRNPWGYNGSVVDALPGSWQAYEQTFWRTVSLNAGGVFAIPASTFKRYFWQLGWAS